MLIQKGNIAAVLAQLESEQRKFQAGIYVSTLLTEPGDIENRILTFIATADDPKRDGNLVHTEGIHFEHFARNPLMPLCHNYSQPPVGKWLAYTQAKLPSGKNALIVRGQFMPPDIFPDPKNWWAQLADACWAMYRPENSFANVVSAGWMNIPGKTKSYKRDGIAGLEFFECELLEISACFLQADRNAIRIDRSVLSQAVARGFMTADLASRAEKVAQLESSADAYQLGSFGTKLTKSEVEEAKGVKHTWTVMQDPVLKTASAGDPGSGGEGGEDHEDETEEEETAAEESAESTEATEEGDGDASGESPSDGSEGEGGPATEPDPVAASQAGASSVRAYLAGVLSDEMDPIIDRVSGTMLKLSSVVWELGYEGDRMYRWDATLRLVGAALGWNEARIAEFAAKAKADMVMPSYDVMEAQSSPGKQALRYARRALILSTDLAGHLSDAVDVLEIATAEPDPDDTLTGDEGEAAASEPGAPEGEAVTVDDPVSAALAPLTASLATMADIMKINLAAGRKMSTKDGSKAKQALRLMIEALGDAGLDLSDLIGEKKPAAKAKAPAKTKTATAGGGHGGVNVADALKLIRASMKEGGLLGEAPTDPS